MTKPHPSLALRLDLDERVDSYDLRLEIDRCYSYLGTPIVRTHPASDGEPCNTMVCTVRLGNREYLDSSAEGSDELWGDVVEHWLHNQVHAVENHMRIFNRRQREEGRDELRFQWLAVELAGGRLTVRMRLDSQCGINPADSRWVGRVREALNQGLLGDDVAEVRLPSEASWAVQYREGMEALEQRKVAEQEQRRREEEERRRQAALAEEAAAEAFLESPELLARKREEELLAQEAGDLVVKARIKEDLRQLEGQMSSEEIVERRIAEEAHIGEDVQRKYALPEADFPLRFDCWDVVRSDGSTKEFRWQDAGGKE